MPESVSDWDGLTDDELLVLFRKVAAANQWMFDTRFGHEFSGRLIAALKQSTSASATVGQGRSSR
jgi:hypothetical protein